MFIRVLIGTVLFSLFFNAQISFGQTVVAVDLEKARLSWNWASGTGGAADQFNVKCGASSGVYTLNHTVPFVADPTDTYSVPVNDVVQGVLGQYFCVVTASNEFGESDPSNEVSFVVGKRPDPATNLLIQSQ